MDEELLAIIKKMEADGQSENDIAKVVQAYDAEKASSEKKNPIQNEPSGESLEESGSLDSSASQMEDGSLGSSSTTPNETPQEGADEVPSVASDMWNGLKAGAKQALADLAGIPNMVNKAVFSLAAPKELEDYVNTLEPDQREDFINNMIGRSGESVSSAMGKFGEEGGDKQEELDKKAEKLRSKMSSYETSITEDLGNLDFAQAGRRIAVQGVATIPSIIETMIPYVGLTAVGMGAAANKQEQLENEGADFGGATSVNAALTGVINSVVEKYTQGQGNRLIKSILGKGEAVVSKAVNGFIDGLKEVGKGALKEGGTEALQQAGEELTDAITTGNEKKAFDIFTEISDNFLIGFAVGAPMKGGEVIANAIRQSSQERKADNARQVEGEPTDLNISRVEPIDELKTQLKYITEKEGLEPDVRAGLMKELNEKIKAIEQGTESEKITQETKPKSIEEKVVSKINEGRTSGKNDEEIIKNFGDSEEKATAEIILKREKDQKLTPEEAMVKTKAAAEKSREEQSKGDVSHLTTAEKAINAATDLYVDRQGSVKNILNAGGLSTTTDFMVSKLGASSYAKHMSEEAHNKTFRNLKEADKKTLEEIILLKNIISIDSEREKLGLRPVKHQGGETSVSAQKSLDGYKSDVGAKKFKELEERANNYFDVNRDLLTTMKKEGLISDGTYNKLITRDYQSRVYLDFLKDMEGNFLSEELENFETASLSAEQIKTMKGGSEGSQSMDSQTLQQRAILARTKAVFANRLNVSFAKELKPALKELKVLEGKENLTSNEKKKLRNLKHLDSSVKMDEIIGYSESGKPKYKLSEANTKGYKPIYYYEDGVANRIFIKEDLYNKFTDTSNQILSSSTRENISKLSGTRLVKMLATGQNPLFFITNVPRDLAFALAFSKEYGSGAKTIVPLELTKLIIDFAKGSGQAISKGSSYRKYLEYGGGMDFLSIQGRYGKEGIFNRYVENSVAEKLTDVSKTKAVKGVKWLMDGMRRFNTASEFATRIAVFDRSIHNQLKKMGVKDINSLTKEKQDLVYTKAVRSARELADFNQGGRFTKAADSAVPYLNAAAQGTRAAVENFKRDPWGTTSRLLQISSGFSALAITFAFNYIGVNRDDNDEEIKGMTDQEIYFNTLDAVSQYDLDNYYIFPKGKKDSKGNWEYWRVAKAQSLTPFINTSEHFLRKFYSEAHGIDYKQEDYGHTLWNAINTNILPVGTDFKSTVGRVPLVNAYVASLGIDAYTGNPLDWKHGEIPAELEGINDDRVESFYKDLGAVVDYSPVRMKKVLESFITTPSTNPYVGFGYMGADYISNGVKKDMLKEFEKTSIKRISKTTSEYNKISKTLSRVNDKIVDVYRKHLTVESEVRKAVKEAKKNDNVKPLEDSLNKVFKDNPEMAEKAIKWAKSELEKKKLNPFVNSLKFEKNKEVRAIMLVDKFGDALLKSEDSYTEKEKEIVKELVKEGVLDSEVYKNYQKLVKK